MDRYQVYCDAACKGNPGLSGVGIVIYKDGREVFTCSKLLSGDKTVNEAEYLGLIYSLKCMRMLNIKEADLHMDSKLVVCQVNGEWQVNSASLRKYHRRATKLLSNFTNTTLTHVRRLANERADELSRINE